MSRFALSIYNLGLPQKLDVDQVHEFSITSSLVETVLELAREKEAKRVLQVNLKIGKLRALSIEQMKFSYRILAKDTLLEGSRLIIEEVPGNVNCSACDYREEFALQDETFHFGVPFLTCPHCGSSMTINGGDECIISKIRMILPTPVQSAHSS
jgi:hydrogenase nickel incorporation protein HypA/HybF